MFYSRVVTKVAVAAMLGGLYRNATLNSHSDERNVALATNEFRSYPIKKITALTHDTKAFDIELNSRDVELGGKTAFCLVVKGPKGQDGKPQIRPYTPTSLSNEKGHFELIVKSYPEGNVSKYFNELKVGDFIEVKGPFPKFEYVANSKKTITFLAGGSGITPMIQVIKEILANPNDKTEINLIFANATEKDIILKSYFDGLAKKYKNQVKVTYFVSDEKFKGGYTGRITKEHLEKLVPKPSNDSLVLVCGPPRFMRAISFEKTPNGKQGDLGGYLKELGFTEEQVYKY